MNILKTLIIESFKIAVISWLVLGLIHLINIHQTLGLIILSVFAFCGMGISILLHYGRKQIKLKQNKKIMKIKITKEYLLEDIKSLLNQVDSDTYYEATDISEKAISILELVKEYLENETKNLQNL